ncbi:MAG: AraC family transcriptional regulator [Moraxellaceae bacterium]
MSSSAPAEALAWISVRHLQHMIARGEAAGLPMQSLLDEAGILPAQLADPDGLLSISAVEALLVRLSQRYADPLLGLHLASDIRPATFGVLGYILQASATLGDVLEVLVRYNGLLSNIGRTSLRFGPGTVEVVWECLAGGEAFRRQATDYVIGIFVVISRLLLGEKAQQLRAVHLAHSRPADAERVREYADFFRAPVYFAGEHSSVVMAVDALRLKLPHGDAVLKELMEAHALQLLRQRSRETSLADAVRHLVEVMLADGVPGREMVAQQLGMSERSLHRHLQALGTSWRAIMDAARMDMAHARLCGTQASASEIAELLGFSTHQAFLRWFRQSTGMTPGEYRRQQAALEKSGSASQ